MTSDNWDRWFSYGVDIANRTILLSGAPELYHDESGEIGHIIADRFIQGFHILARTQAPITVLINTPGGDWHKGMAIYHVIKQCPAFVTAEVLGEASSMGSIILQAADHRVIHPHAVVLTHDGSEGFDGHAQDFIKAADYSKVCLETMYQIYADATGKTKAWWRRKCKHDQIFTAKEALEVGLVDSIKDYV